MSRWSILIHRFHNVSFHGRRRFARTSRRRARSLARSAERGGRRIVNVASPSRLVSRDFARFRAPEVHYTATQSCLYPNDVDLCPSLALTGRRPSFFPTQKMTSVLLTTNRNGRQSLACNPLGIAMPPE